MRYVPANKRRLRFEVLEDRRLLSASLQINFSAYENAISPDDSRIAKIGYELALISHLASNSQLDAIPESSALLSMTRFAEQREVIYIDAVATDTAVLLAKDLESIGMTNIASAGRLVSGQLPVTAIDALHSLNTLAFARPSFSPISFVGLANSQGDESQRTDVIRSFTEFDGADISIGIISNSFDYAHTDQNFTELEKVS